MPSTVKRTKFLFVLLMAAAISICFSGQAQARLGEDFSAYKGRISNSFSQIGQSGDNYMFKMNIDPKQAAASPGYAGGLTVTVANGKITGQSLAIRPGLNAVVGATLATVHGLMFSYEALGRQPPKSQELINNELKAFGGAIKQAFMGHPQNIRYPGNPGVITISHDKMGNYIIACRFAAASPAAQAGAAKPSNAAASPSPAAPAPATVKK